MLSRSSVETFLAVLSKFIARDPANRDERPDHRVSKNSSRKKEREREIPWKDGERNTVGIYKCI